MSRPPVMLVGAGPGDPDLVTLRAEELLGQAEIVVADATLGALVARFAPAADVVAVPPDRAAVDEVLSAATCRRVIRLYRGDPWLHPAYEDEREALERFGMAVEAVSGVALELAVPALAGVPVHVRHLAVACTLGPHDAMPPAASAARTLVVSGDDPAAVIRAMAATPGARPAALVPVADPRSAWRGPLADALPPAAAMTGPTLLVLGDVCRVPPPPRVASLPEARSARSRGGASSAAADAPASAAPEAGIRTGGRPKGAPPSTGPEGVRASRVEAP